jgi:hypothetical protein
MTVANVSDESNINFSETLVSTDLTAQCHNPNDRYRQTFHTLQKGNLSGTVVTETDGSSKGKQVETEELQNLYFPSEIFGMILIRKNETGRTCRTQ